MIYGLCLKTGEKLLTSNILKLVPEDYNDPDITIESPYQIHMDITKPPYIVRYLGDYTEQTSFSFRTEDILTFFDPNLYLRRLYSRMNIAEERQLELFMQEPKVENIPEED